MLSERSKTLLEFAVGIVVIGAFYTAVSIAIIRQMQAFVDGPVRPVPWYYSIAGLFVSLPLLAPANYFFQYLRPLFTPFAGIFGSADNAGIFAFVVLDGIFWGAVVVFVSRFVRRKLRGKELKQLLPTRGNGT